MASDTTTTVEPQALAMWGDRSVVLASEYRAVKATSQRRALWAALGAAAIASMVTLRFVYVPALRSAESTPFRATPNAAPAPAPEPGTSSDAVAPPIASQVAPLVSAGVSAPTDAAPKPVAQPRRKKTPAAVSAAPVGSVVNQAEVSSAPSVSVPIAAPAAGSSAVPEAPAVSARPATSARPAVSARPAAPP